VRSSRPARALRGLRAWFLLHLDELRLIPIISLVALGIIGLFFALAPVGPPVALEGRVVALGYYETATGSHGTASVRTEGRLIRINLPLRHGCRAGDRIQLSKWPLRWGQRISAERTRWPCSRPAPFSQQS